MKRAERRRNDFFFQDAHVSAPIGYWEIDRLNNRVYWSAEVYRIFGLAPDSFVPTRDSMLAAVHPDDVGQVEGCLDSSPALPGPFHLIHRIRRRDGAVRVVDLRCRTEADPKGAPSRSMGTVQDITEQAEAEDRLRLNEARLQSLVRISQYRAESVGDLFEFALEEALRLTGSRLAHICHYDEERRRFTEKTWSRSVLKECRVQDAAPLQDVDQAGILAESIRQRRPVLRNDFQAPDPLKKGAPRGHAVIRRYLSIPVFQGQRIVGVVGVANKEADYDQTDILQLTLLMDSVWKITEQRRIEAALRESERRMETLISNLPGIAYRCRNDARWTMEFISAGCRELTGYGPDDLIGNAKLSYHDLILPEDRGTDGVAGALRERRPYCLTYRIRSASGAVKWVWEQGRGVYDEAGRPQVLEGFITDITDRRRAEEALRQSMISLKSTLAATVKAMVTTIEFRDPYTAGHQRRAAALAAAIALEMGLAEDTVEGIRTAASIHDLGKISVPSEILSKPASLAEVEWRMVRTHPQIGYEILKDLEFPWPIDRIVLQHHERLDGSGYPQGLRGPAILQEARILAVADVVEAMSSHRPYRPSVGTEAALIEIGGHSGSLYDADVTAACLRLFRDKGYAL